jgi:hypothetical protein
MTNAEWSKLTRRQRYGNIGADIARCISALENQNYARYESMIAMALVSSRYEKDTNPNFETCHLYCLIA